MSNAVQQRHTHIFPKESDGHYVEPAWCSRRLFEVEKFKGPIVDPACGWGTILHEAAAAGYQVIGNDIVDRCRYPQFTVIERDFLAWSNLIGDVVCNPPFDLVRGFCEHAVKLRGRRVDRKVAMICLVRRLNAAHWLEDLPLRRIWLLTPRPSMPPGSWIAAGNKPGGGTQDFCWLVFEHGYAGPPEIGWLHRDRGLRL